MGGYGYLKYPYAPKNGPFWGVLGMGIHLGIKPCSQRPPFFVLFGSKPYVRRTGEQHETKKIPNLARKIEKGKLASPKYGKTIF